MSPFQKTVVVLSGAGMSAESGLKTFRDAGGLWEGHRPEEVATPHAWETDPDMVRRFYNARRRQLEGVQPNAGHLALARLESGFHVQIVTQNVDDLHERAGSTSVLHLHGELTKARSVLDPGEVISIGYRDLHADDLCSAGLPLRPAIVWFGEAVPAMDAACEIVATADFLIVVGTSLAVYPAASLAWCAPPDARCFMVNPVIPPEAADTGFILVKKTAAEGVPEIVDSLLALVSR